VWLSVDWAANLWIEASTTCLVWEISFYLSWFNFIQSQFDSSLFLRMNATRIVVFLVYVNDFVIKECDYQLIEQLKKHINTSFHMKDFGILQYFLSLEVRCCSTSTLLHKHKYTQELLTLAILKSSNLDLAPIEVNLKLQQKYQQLIRSLNYFTITWPHISFII